MLTSVWRPAGPRRLPLPGFTTWMFLLFRHEYCLLNQSAASGGFFTWEQLKKLAQDLDVWKTPPMFHKGLPAKVGVFNWWFVGRYILMVHYFTVHLAMWALTCKSGAYSLLKLQV